MLVYVLSLRLSCKFFEGYKQITVLQVLLMLEQWRISILQILKSIPNIIQCN